MGTDYKQVTAEVAKLEQYLLNVWQWNDLGDLAEERHGLNLALEPYEPGFSESERVISERLASLLSTCLEDAITEVDKALSEIPEGDFRDVQLQALLDSLRGLQRPTACWKQWCALGEHRYAQQQEAEYLEGAPTPMDAWALIEGDVHRYIARLVQHIEEGITEAEQPAPSHLPIFTWMGTAGELAALIYELQRQGWIPKLSDDRQARLVLQAFKLQDGSPPCEAGSMKTYLANKGQQRPGDMGRLQLPKKQKAQ